MRLHQDVKTRLIKGTSLFRDCTSDEVAEVAAIADEFDFREGRQLTTENTDGHEFVVVIDGTAEVFRDGTKVDTIGAGEWFGEVALLNGTRRNATVVAKTAVHALVIEGHRFLTLLEHSTSIRTKVEGALAEHGPASE